MTYTPQRSARLHPPGHDAHHTRDYLRFETPGVNISRPRTEPYDIEHWRDEAALQSHSASEHFQAFVGAFVSDELQWSVQLLKEARART